jgi:hypothetical protein
MHHMPQWHLARLTCKHPAAGACGSCRWPSTTAAAPCPSCCSACLGYHCKRVDNLLFLRPIEGRGPKVVLCSVLVSTDAMLLCCCLGCCSFGSLCNSGSDGGGKCQEVELLLLRERPDTGYPRV